MFETFSKRRKFKYLIFPLFNSAMDFVDFVFVTFKRLLYYTAMFQLILKHFLIA
jgi:hypothetical protein